MAASLEKEEKVFELLQKPDVFNLRATYPREFVLPAYAKDKKEEGKEVKEKKQPKNSKRPLFPENVTYYQLGEDKNPNLNLPYDVDEYYYLFFVEDYIRIKMMLEKAGLEEGGHYMNGSFLLEDVIEGGCINPNKFTESL